VSRLCALSLQLLTSVFVFLLVYRASAQTQLSYAPDQSWGVFAEYSPSSSHIILGSAREREFTAIGLAYTHVMLRRQHWDLNYLFEVRPLMWESDPVTTGYRLDLDLPGSGHQSITKYYRRPIPVLEVHPARQLLYKFSQNGQTYLGYKTTFYSRRWTYVGGMSPIGVKLNLLRQHRLQPTFQLTGGFAASARDVPMFHTSAGNLTFSFGSGLELFKRSGRALRLQYRIQHFSNADVGKDPGIDSQMIYAGYSWGQRLLSPFHHHSK